MDFCKVRKDRCLMAGIKEELVSLFRSMSVAMTISLSVVFSMFAGVLTGYYLDTWLFSGRTYPWLTLICLFFGLGGGVKNFFILTRRFSHEADKKEAQWLQE
ncbi:MAG: AtpZ/AtpI family protein [Dissulfurimicrobium sp.]|uniref:AtpZ/AtpI family protein n=1 Tax=Dissulfurimicrobium sp. TaxID=2022436 RepID=UPI004049EB75